MKNSWPQPREDARRHDFDEPHEPTQATQATQDIADSAIEKGHGVRALVNAYGVVDNIRIVATRTAALLRASARVAYVGSGVSPQNLGDKAVYEALCAFGNFPFLTPLQYVTRERRLEPWGLGGKRFFDAAIIGGGTLGNVYWQPTYERILEADLPFSFHGTGFGSSGFDMPDHWAADDVLREIVQRSRFVGVRGPLSLERARRLGARNATVVGDTALLYASTTRATPMASKKALINIAIPQGSRDVGVRNSIVRAVRSVCAELLAQRYELVLVAMDPADVQPLEELAADLDWPSLSVYRPRSAPEFMQLAMACRFAVAVRLHVAVLASCVGVPTALIGYRDKARDFLLSMRSNDLLIQCGDESADELRVGLPKLIDGADEIGLRLWQQAHFWRRTQLLALESLGLRTFPRKPGLVR